MNILSALRISAVALIVGLTTLSSPVRCFAQAPAPPAGSDTPATWTTEQLLTSSVHDAWVLSGKDEDKFFEMVKTLTELSADKRGITLPDSKEAGMRMGANIKRLAKADTDQLLYAVVDKAVMIAAHSKAVPAGSRTTARNKSGTTTPASH